MVTALRTLATLAVLVLGGCGFHLRGDVRYPPAMAVTYLAAGDSYTEFNRQLRARLREGGIEVTTDAAAAGAVIRILQDETGQRVVSVSARNTPAEYQVYYVVRYALEIDGRTALASRTLSLTRDYSYDERQVLGKAAEEDEIRAALAADLVGLVTRQLSSVQ